MSFIRGVGAFLGSTIFTTSVMLAILLMQAADFTTYENFKSIASGIFRDQISSMFGEEDLESIMSYFLFQCQQTSMVNVPLGGEPIVLSCNDIRNSDESQLPDLVVKSIIDKMYYKEFDCDFIDCVRSSMSSIFGGGGNFENILIVASDEGNQFYRTSQMYMWIGSAVGLALMIFSIKTWPGRLKGIGLSLVFIGLPFLFLGYIQSLFLPADSFEAMPLVENAVESLMSSLKSKFITVLVAGIVLTAAGYALGFYLKKKSATHPM